MNKKKPELGDGDRAGWWGYLELVGIELDGGDIIELDGGDRVGSWG
jgi:hypothetical protein